MPIRNAHFYSINEGIAYPLDDAATSIADSGARLPSNILTDLNIRWPETLSRYAYLASISVTPTMVSLTIQGCASLDADEFTPLAVLSVPLPAEQGRQYALLPQADGVGGWAVFGSGIEDAAYRGRFTAPRQSFFTARAARAYSVLPVSSLRTLPAAKSLTGVVKLKALDPLAISREEREINGVLRDCVVVRLVDGAGVDGFPVPSDAGRITGYKEQSTFRKFAGPCAGRPESQTCGDPQPMEFINAVGPDCNGQMTIEFSGCADVAQINGTCGVTVSCGLGLIDACLPPQLPNSEGLLPSEYTPTNVPIPDDPVIPPDTGGISESVVVIGELPYRECFFDQTADDFNEAVGLWRVVEDTTDEWRDCLTEATSYSASGVPLTHYAYTTATASARNVSIWEGFDISTLGRKATIHAKLTQGPLGAKHNASLLVNYRPHTSIAGEHVYYQAEIDYDSQEVKISRFNGTVFQTAVSLVTPGIQLGVWYEITMTTEVAPHGGVSLTATFRSLENTTINVTLGPLIVSNFYPSSGSFGVGTNRAISLFSSFLVEVA